MTLLTKWHDLFPQDKPTQNPSAVAGGIDGHQSLSRLTSTGRIRSAWQDDGWDEEHLYPLKGEVEMALLGYLFVGSYYTKHVDDGLNSLMSVQDIFHAQTSNKQNSKVTALQAPGGGDITTTTSQDKQVRGQYRVIDKAVVNSWQSFNDEAAFNTSLVQTISL